MSRRARRRQVAWAHNLWSGEDVQGVLTLFCSGAAQVVCHALRVEELSEQLEVEEEDGDKQEEEVEVESGEVESRRCAHDDDRG